MKSGLGAVEPIIAAVLVVVIGNEEASTDVVNGVPSDVKILEVANADVIADVTADVTVDVTVDMTADVTTDVMVVVTADVTVDVTDAIGVLLQLPF